ESASMPGPAGRYLFSVRSAAVLGSSHDSTPKTQVPHHIPPALKPAAPKTGALRQTDTRIVTGGGSDPSHVPELSYRLAACNSAIQPSPSRPYDATTVPAVWSAERD